MSAHTLTRYVGRCGFQTMVGVLISDEVARVLASKGTFLYVTFRQPHFMKPLLTRERAWTMDVQTLQATKGAFEYFAYIMTRHEA